MRMFLEALNHPAEALRVKPRRIAWLLVAVTITVNAVIGPLMQYFWGEFKREIDIVHMLTVALAGMLSYLLIGLVLWAVSKLLGSTLTLMNHIDAWGITFFPTMVCAVVVAVTEVFFYVFWNNSVWGMLAGFVFVGVLFWKTILYVIYLREFAGLKGKRFFGAFALVGILILVLAWLNAYAGCMTPVL